MPGRGLGKTQLFCCIFALILFNSAISSPASLSPAVQHKFQAQVHQEAQGAEPQFLPGLRYGSGSGVSSGSASASSSGGSATASISTSAVGGGGGNGTSEGTTNDYGYGQGQAAGESSAIGEQADAFLNITGMGTANGGQRFSPL